MRVMLGLVVVAALGCGQRGGGGSGGGVFADAGPRMDGEVCAIRCAPPPAGCTVIPPPEDECSCGTLDCVDAGCGEIECPAPPTGCRYDPDPVDPCSCGVLVCDAGICCGATCDPPEFPTFARSCETDDGCFVAEHQRDCCGSYRSFGLAVSERERFGSAEGICAAMYPACGCAAQPTIADDGSMCFDAPVEVACVAGLCTSRCAI